MEDYCDCVIGGKKLEEWDKEWESKGLLGKLTEEILTPLNKTVGLYRAKFEGKTEYEYIGRAIEWKNGGLRKRLSDYIRLSDSARKSAAGQFMNTRSKELEIEILKVGEDKEAAKIAEKLEVLFIWKYEPRQNKQFK